VQSLKWHHLHLAVANERSGDRGGSVLTTNTELPLWEAAMVDGQGIGKMSTRTTGDENTVR